MGIPAAFRWLSNKYPKIISPVIEDKPIVMDDGSVIPVDTTRSNPNGEEFDHLYLDMNGIVHPCSHPEDRPAPKDEEEMMLEVFKYTDRVVNMVRPRKLLMIAIGIFSPDQAHPALLLNRCCRWCRPPCQNEPATIPPFPLSARGQREGGRQARTICDVEEAEWRRTASRDARSHNQKGLRFQQHHPRHSVHGHSCR